MGTWIRNNLVLLSGILLPVRPDPPVCQRYRANGFTGCYFRDNLVNAFGLIIMGFLLIGLSVLAMTLNRKYIQSRA